MNGTWIDALCRQKSGAVYLLFGKIYHKFLQIFIFSRKMPVKNITRQSTVNSDILVKKEEKENEITCKKVLLAVSAAACVADYVPVAGIESLSCREESLAEWFLGIGRDRGRRH